MTVKSVTAKINVEISSPHSVCEDLNFPKRLLYVPTLYVSGSPYLKPIKLITCVAAEKSSVFLLYTLYLCIYLNYKYSLTYVEINGKLKVNHRPEYMFYTTKPPRKRLKYSHHLVITIDNQVLSSP